MALILEHEWWSSNLAGSFVTLVTVIETWETTLEAYDKIDLDTQRPIPDLRLTTVSSLSQ